MFVFASVEKCEALAETLTQALRIMSIYRKAAASFGTVWCEGANNNMPPGSKC